MAAVLSMPSSIAVSIAFADEPAGGKPSHGAALTALNPSAAAAFAAAANPVGVRGLVARFTLA